MAAVLEILRKDLSEPVHFRVRPQMGVEPRQPVHRGPTQRGQHDFPGRIDYTELPHEVLGFEPCQLQRQQRLASEIVERASDRGYELDDALMREHESVIGEPRAQHLACHTLFVGIAGIETINEDVRVNEACHGYTDLLCSSRAPGHSSAASFVARARVAAQWPRRTGAPFLLERCVRRCAIAQALGECHPPTQQIRPYRRARSRTDQRSASGS